MGISPTAAGRAFPDPSENKTPPPQDRWEKVVGAFDTFVEMVETRFGINISDLQKQQAWRHSVGGIDVQHDPSKWIPVFHQAIISQGVTIPVRPIPIRPQAVKPSV